MLGFGVGCDSLSVDDRDSSRDGQTESSKVAEKDLQIAFAVQDSLETAILGYEEIVGLATAVSESGERSILVLLKSPIESWGASKKTIVPETASGFPVKVMVTGEIYAPRSSSSSTLINGAAEFSRPVPIGVSTGSANGPTGTIAARVTDGVNFYALSNNHVYSRSNESNEGDPVIQPGSVDGGNAEQHTIGNLSSFEPIVFGGECVNTIDAAIAQSSSAVLDNTTPSGGYGIPQSEPLPVSTPMIVQKYGRSSGLTEGLVIAVNATVMVSYGQPGIACFTDQIIISDGSFSTGGDSGSLVVTKSINPNLDARPVGLLFAGSPTISVANDINNVLSRMGVSIDGTNSNSGNAGGDNSGDTGGGNSGDTGGGNGGDTGGGNDGNNGGGNDGNSGGDDDFEADIQTFSEILLRVVDSSDEFVAGINICAWSSTSLKTCAESLNTTVDGTFNWTAELEGGGTEFLIELDQDTDYILQTSGSANAWYYFYHFMDGDVEGTFTVTDAELDEGSFAITENIGTAKASIVNVSISNVVVGTPRTGGTAINITWDADWSGSPVHTFPTFLTTTASVSLINGGTTLLSASESHASGSGSYNWTPNQQYSSVRIEVKDDQGGEPGESSEFDVDSPITFDIEGPTSRNQGQEGTWDVIPTGGTSPYSYDWDYLFICSSESLSIRVETCDTWNQGGTGWQWSKSVSGAEFDMKIRITVTDSHSPTYTKVDSLIVDIIDI